MAGCLDPEILSNHLDGRLEPDRVRQIEAHCRTCLACRRRLEEAALLREWMRSLEPIEEELASSDRILAEVREVVHRGVGETRARTPRRFGVVLGMGLLLFGGLATPFLLDHDDGERDDKPPPGPAEPPSPSPNGILEESLRFTTRDADLIAEADALFATAPAGIEVDRQVSSPTCSLRVSYEGAETRDVEFFFEKVEALLSSNADRVASVERNQTRRR